MTIIFENSKNAKNKLQSKNKIENYVAQVNALHISTSKQQLY